MTLISTHKNMIKLYYSSKSSIGKQTYSYVNASFKDLLAIDVIKSNVTGTQWKELAEQLGISIKDLVDQSHPIFIETYNNDVNLDEEGWIKVLNKSPEVFNFPIVILGNTYFHIKNPSDIEKHLDPNSKGIDEKKHI
jgi:arsenate reductase-like glutaredoxin family protein